MATATTEMTSRVKILTALAGRNRTAKQLADDLGAKLAEVLDELYELQAEGRVLRRVEGKAVARWTRLAR